MEIIDINEPRSVIIQKCGWFFFMTGTKKNLNPQFLGEPFVLVADVPLFELDLATCWALHFRIGPLKMSLLKTVLSKGISTECLVGMM